MLYILATWSVPLSPKLRHYASLLFCIIKCIRMMDPKQTLTISSWRLYYTHICTRIHSERHTHTHTHIHTHGFIHNNIMLMVKEKGRSAPTTLGRCCRCRGVTYTNEEYNIMWTGVNGKQIKQIKTNKSTTKQNQSFGGGKNFKRKKKMRKFNTARYSKPLLPSKLKDNWHWDIFSGWNLLIGFFHF